MKYNTNDRTSFGGLILPSDFETEYGGCRNIASRIFTDWKFDQQCYRNILLRERNKNYAKS